MHKIRIIESRRSALLVDGELLGWHFIGFVEHGTEIDPKTGILRSMTLEEVCELERQIDKPIALDVISRMWTFLSKASEENGTDGAYKLALNGPNAAKEKTFHVHGLLFRFLKEEYEEMGWDLRRFVDSEWLITRRSTTEKSSRSKESPIWLPTLPPAVQIPDPNRPA